MINLGSCLIDSLKNFSGDIVDEDVCRSLLVELDVLLDDVTAKARHMRLKSKTTDFWLQKVARRLAVEDEE